MENYLKREMIKKTKHGDRGTTRTTRRIHMIVVFRVTARCSDTETQRVGLGSTNPGTHPANVSQNVIFDASQWEESHSSYKSIFIKFSQMFDSI